MTHDGVKCRDLVNNNNEPVGCIISQSAEELSPSQNGSPPFS